MSARRNEFMANNIGNSHETDTLYWSALISIALFDVLEFCKSRFMTGYVCIGVYHVPTMEE